MRLISVMTVLLLAGCAFTSETYDAKGNPATEVRCSWAFPDACYDKAKQLCPNGYKVARQNMEFSMFKHQNIMTFTCNK